METNERGTSEDDGGVYSRTRSQKEKRGRSIIPTAVILEHILPSLDRDTWIMLCCTCRELYNVSRALGPPWPHRSIQVGSNAKAVAFSPDGELLIVGSTDGVVRVWRRSNGRRTILEGHTSVVRSLAFSTKFLASAGYDATIRLWDLSDYSSSRVLEGHPNVITSIDFSPSGSILASGSADGSVRLWDVNDGRCTGILIDERMGYIFSVKFSPLGGGTLASAGSGRIDFWDISGDDEGNVLPSFTFIEGHDAAVRAIAYSPDGLYFASGSFDRTIRLWNAANHSCVALFTGHDNIVIALAFSPNGKILASGSLDGDVRFWKVQVGGGGGDGSSSCLVHIARHHKYCLNSIVFSPDGRTLVSGGDDGTVLLWNPSEHDRRQQPGNWDELFHLWNAEHDIWDM
jgi:WD40 repeat protein